MKTAQLLWVHAWYEALELLRQPSYVVSTVLFPAMFFGFFGVPNAQDQAAARLLTGSFSAFALLGVVLFQFAVGIAQERGTPWAGLLRLLPLPAWIHMAARLLASAFFATLAIGGVLFVSALWTPAHLPLAMTLRLVAVLFVCGIPFGLLGLIIGLCTNEKSVLPIGNLIYLPLSFAGGLWLPPSILPKAIQDLSPYLPTRLLGELVWSVSKDTDFKAHDIQGLIAFTLVFATVAYVLQRRDQERSFN